MIGGIDLLKIFFLGLENFLDAEHELLGDAKGQRQAGVELARFDRVDGLMRHIRSLARVIPVPYRPDGVLRPSGVFA